jgi:hypothetical protein
LVGQKIFFDQNCERFHNFEQIWPSFISNFDQILPTLTFNFKQIFSILTNYYQLKTNVLNYWGGGMLHPPPPPPPLSSDESLTWSVLAYVQAHIY